MKDYSHLLKGPISAIFNASIRESFVPKLWKIAEVCAIPKRLPPQSVEDLRPISITSVLSKELEKFICDWIMDIIGNKIDISQYGCLKGTSTTHALVDLIHSWSKAVDSLGTIVRILLLDFRKAYDLVDNTIVLGKLEKLGAPCILVNWIRAFLTDREQSTKIGAVSSKWEKLCGGVPQGTRVGPLLFLVMVNDLQCDLPSVKYVDDTTIYEVLKAGELSKMQEAANSCHQWAIKNKMQINTTKTKEILIDFTKKKRDLPPLSINNTQIERVSSQKLLGIQISHDLSWKEHVNQIVCKASKRIYQIVMLKRANVQIDDLVRIYTTIIRPILEYACQVWHTRLTIEQSYQIEQVQKRVLRILFHNMPYEEALKLSGLLTLKERKEYYV